MKIAKEIKIIFKIFTQLIEKLLQKKQQPNKILDFKDNENNLSSIRKMQ